MLEGKIEFTGKTTSDVMDAVSEALRRINDDNTSGMDRNSSSSFSFEISGEEEIRWDVHYRVITGIDGTVVGENHYVVVAPDEEIAGRRAERYAHEDDPLTDPRIDPRVEIVSVTDAGPED